MASKTRFKLLSALKDGSWVDARKLAIEVYGFSGNVERAAIYETIFRLRKQGVPIVAKRGKGYKLEARP